MKLIAIGSIGTHYYILKATGGQLNDIFGWGFWLLRNKVVDHVQCDV